MREDEILERLNGGDASALDELVRAYYPDILRYCRRHSPDEASAEDAAQETFLKAVRHLDAHAFRGRFRAWLYKIAANTCADRCRRETPAEPLSDSPYIDPGFERTELGIDLGSALAALPEAQREVVLLRYVHGLKLREAAEVLGVPLRTAQSRERAALKALKKLL